MLTILHYVETPKYLLGVVKLNDIPCGVSVDAGLLVEYVFSVGDWVSMDLVGVAIAVTPAIIFVFNT